MAGIAGGRVSSGNVVGDRTAEGLSAVPLRDMAAVAGSVRRGEGIVVVDVAVRAGLHAAGGGDNVAAREGPSGSAVIELAVGPRERVVAGGAHGSGEVRGDMVGYSAAKSCSAIPIGSVAAGVVAVRNSETVIVADVALIAIGDHAGWRHLVIADESPTSGGVIPRSGGERVGSGVAVGAVGCKKGCACGGMHGVIGVLPVGLMATGVCAIRGGGL